MQKVVSLFVLLTCSTFFSMAQVRVFTDETLGPVKPMNAVNNGPVSSRSSQTKSNCETFCAARIPYVRTHDSSLSSSYGAEHTVDISAIFPDFTKNPKCPDSYDFAVTDKYLSDIVSVGSKVFFRLGQRIENQIKKYNVYPPKDFKKWAVICEHIIRHYNEGWCNGFHYGIEYWEIWNEADLDLNEKDWKNAPRNWGGSPEQFFEFFATAANHLNKCFPDLKIGGPALCGDLDWADDFLAYMDAHEVEMDFFSWHIYTDTPEKVIAMAGDVDRLLAKHGYEGIESILNEWNYVRSWSMDFVYSVKMVNSMKGAAFSAATMAACQDTNLDMLMYYDARPSTSFNGLFDFVTMMPSPGYYPFYAWSRLRDYENQVKASVDGSLSDIYAVAAKNDKGLAVLVCRYNDDDNVSAHSVIELDFGDAAINGMYRAHITDEDRLFTEIPVFVKNGKTSVLLAPESFIFIEL